MRITIRPAPHSKQCALGAQGCTKGRNNPAACQTCDTCCERKHCVLLADALAGILTAQGHAVTVIGDAYALGYPSEKANENAYAALREVARISPDLHIALHTNSAAASVRGVRIGYPEGGDQRAARAYILAELVAARNRAVYPLPDKVQTCTYTFLELSRPKCPALYIEAAFANSNAEDARWIHDNTQAIAQSYAQGIADWQKTEEASKAMNELYTATIATSGEAGLYLWTSSQKTERVIQAKKGAYVSVLSAPDSKGFCLCRYRGKTGWADGQYLKRNSEPAAPSVLLEKLYAARTAQISARVALDAAIRAAGGE